MKNLFLALLASIVLAAACSDSEPAKPAPAPDGEETFHPTDARPADGVSGELGALAEPAPDPVPALPTSCEEVATLCVAECLKAAPAERRICRAGCPAAKGAEAGLNCGAPAKPIMPTSCDEAEAFCSVQCAKLSPLMRNVCKNNCPAGLAEKVGLSCSFPPHKQTIPLPPAESCDEVTAHCVPLCASSDPEISAKCQPKCAEIYAAHSGLTCP